MIVFVVFDSFAISGEQFDVSMERLRHRRVDSFDEENPHSQHSDESSTESLLRHQQTLEPAPTIR